MNVSNFHRLVDGKKGVRRKPGKTTGKPMMIDGITKTSRPLYFLPKGHYWNGYFLNGNIIIINHNNVLLDIIMDIIMV